MIVKGETGIKSSIGNIKSINMKNLNPAYVIELLKVAESFRERNAYLNEYMSETVKEHEKLQQELADTKETLLQTKNSLQVAMNGQAVE